MVHAALATGPLAGSAVMATGIVAVALRTTGHRDPSVAFVLAAAVLWVVVGAVVLVRALRAPRSVAEGAAHPEALTAVAATGVIGSWCAADGRPRLATALLVLAAVLWVLLIGPALRRLPERAHGGTFLVCVGTEAVAALAAGVAATRDAPWLLWPAAVLVVVGLLAYLDVLRRFGPGELLTGRGDHWVAGGALAIAALAVAKWVGATATLGVLTDAGDVLRSIAVAAAIAAVAWLPVLLVVEVLRPRPRYDVRRWATVFPVGMYAAASAATATATRHDVFRDFARGWVWVAVVVWALVLVGAVVRGGELARGAVRD